MDIVTSWRVLTDMLPSSKSTGTITDWQQGRGALLVGGDARVIRVWDAAREFCISVSLLSCGNPESKYQTLIVDTNPPPSTIIRISQRDLELP